MTNSAKHTPVLTDDDWNDPVFVAVRQGLANGEVSIRRGLADLISGGWSKADARAAIAKATGEMA